MTIDPSEFRRVLGHHPTGVTVVTTVDDDGPCGMAIGSFASVSLDPPLVMFCPGKSSASWERMKRSGAFCVNVLGDDQEHLSGIFASKADDKFSGVDWTTEATGSPVFPHAIAWIDCSTYAIYDGGDHDIVVGEVQALSTAANAGERGPLLFFQGGYGRFGAL
ncbi:MAG: flavin reductase family protein [Acidimicrobiales bacterium]